MGLELKRKRLPWKIWSAGVVIWTLLLIAPGNWFPGGGSQTVGSIGAGKLLHVGCYACLAGSAGWLPRSMRWRHIASLGLILHGGLTELIQTQVPYREGCWSDVAIDTVAILIGFAVSRRSWPA